VAGQLAAGAILVYLFVMTSWQMRVQQEVVEDNHRRRIGLWLKDHVRPGERVLLEALGYFGYFSGAHILDFPGLVSPDVVRLRQARDLGIAGLAAALEPEWVVPRGVGTEVLLSPPCFQNGPVGFFGATWGTLATPAAPAALLAATTFSPSPYALALGKDGRPAVFDVRRELLEKHADVPGFGYLLFDSTFAVLRRTAPATRGPVPRSAP
jgi:hypothetical protein